MEKRLIVGLGDQSNWSLVHLASIYARLEDGNKYVDFQGRPIQSSPAFTHGWKTATAPWNVWNF